MILIAGLWNVSVISSLYVLLVSIRTPVLKLHGIYSEMLWKYAIPKRSPHYIHSTVRISHINCCTIARFSICIITVIFLLSILIGVLPR